MSHKINLSIEQLENSYWGEPSNDYPSQLIEKCYNLRKLPICELSVENLRMLIGQDIGIPYIMPIALKLLAENPWCSGDFFNGDLLQNVLKVNVSFWIENVDLFSELDSIMIELSNRMETYQKTLLPSWGKIMNGMHGTK